MIWRIKKIVAPFFVFISFLSATCSFQWRKENKCGFLHITVSAQKSLLQINWKFTCEYRPDSIILYETFDTMINQELLKIRIGPKKRIGSVTTDIKVDVKRLPCYWYPADKEPCDEHCLPYYIQSFRKGVPVDWQCLSIEPSWMKDFGKLRIGSMVIPGQVKAGATTTTLSLMSRYYSYQNLPFWPSLVYGIRYFDISVGVHGLWWKDFHTYSSSMICSPLKPELEDLADFLKKSTREVVIIDLSQFIHFSNSDHDALVKLLMDVFGKMIAPPYISNHKFGPKLEDMWETKKRIIINYRNDYATEKYDFLWNNIHHKNVLASTWKELASFIKKEGSTNVYQKQMSCVTLALFPSWKQLVVQSQMEHADSINPYLTHWLDKFTAFRRINIVATSFFLGNSVISRAILENNRKLRTLIRKKKYATFAKNPLQ